MAVLAPVCKILAPEETKVLLRGLLGSKLLKSTNQVKTLMLSTHLV